MKSRFKGIILSSSCATALAVFMLPVGAANAQTTTSPQAGAAHVETLGEVVVTAERRTSTAQKTAASVSVRSGTQLLQQGRYQLSNIIEDVPGIAGGAKVDGGSSAIPGSDNPAAGLIIRGIPSNTPGGGSITSAAAAAALYVDDVYNGVGGGYDLDRVEVLRGPQGTLYGRSATTGVVAIHTGDPDLHKLGGNISAEDGTANLHRVSGAVDVPIIDDKVALRISGSRYERDGFDTPQGARTTSSDGRVKLLVKPTDNFTALFGAAWEDNMLRTGGLNMTEFPLGVYTYTPVGIQEVDTRNRQLWTNMNLDLGGVGLTYIGAYRNFQASGWANLGTLNQTISVPSDHFWTNEFRVHSQNDSTLQWQAGVTSYLNDMHDQNLIVSPSTGTTSADSIEHKKTTAVGAFAEATWHVLPNTRITGGLRYDYTDVQNDEIYSQSISSFPPIPALITSTISGDTGHRTFGNVTYKARIEQDLTPVNMLYAMASTGFSPGDVALATNAGGAPVVTSFQAETLYAYEAGSKNRFFDNRLEVNADVYYEDYGGFQTAVNVGSAFAGIYRSVLTPITAYGGEFEAIARPWTGGQIGLNMDYVFSRYHNIDPLFQPFFARSEIVGVVPFKLTLSGDQAFPLGESTTFSVHGDLRYHSAYDAARLQTNQLAWLPYAVDPAGVIEDISATLSFDHNRYALTGYVRNVGNLRQLNANVPFVFISNTPAASPLPTPPFLPASSGMQLTDPRTFGVVATAKF